MSTHYLFTKAFCGLAALMLALTAPTLHAQAFAIDWYKVSGGGGTSTGATYQITGTLGQADAGGTMAGGNYSLTGGFWSLIAAVQTPGAPRLAIARTTTNTVVVSWPSSATGFTLQQNTSGIATVNWTNVVSAPADDGTTKTCVVNPPLGKCYYRLIKP